MFNNIVIGINGRDGGHSAVALARRLAAENAEITLANVYGTQVVAGRGAALAVAWEADASEILLQQECEQAGLPDANLLRSSQTSVGRGLHEIAEDVNADLLVIGATHRQGAARALLGDDTASVLHEAPCPVAIAPLHYEPSKHPSSIGVGYDGSRESSQALVAARSLAERLGASLQVLAVVPVHVKPYWERDPASSPEAKIYAARLPRVPELQGLDLKMIEGNPADQLTNCTQDLDLLVVGTRSQGLMGRLLTGSVARHLALHSACPLLIWPRLVAREDESVAVTETSSVHH